VGFGDAILATGHAKPLYKEGQRIYFGTKQTRPDGEYELNEEVFRHNPYLATPDQYPDDLANDFKDCIFVDNYMGHRPYVGYRGGMTNVDWCHDYRAPVGDVWLLPEEIERGKQTFGEDYILIEPHTKNTVGGNKNWLWGRWQEVADRLDGDVLQNGTPKKKLRDVRREPMPSFRDALVAVKNAKLVITTQGGLHVAAAALGTPAVAIWGEYAHPRNLGYENHVNFYAGDKKPCGNIVECSGCVQAMKRITVDMVVDAANSLC